MRRAHLALVLLIWLASRCSHTETVNRPAEQSETRQEAGEAKPATEKREAKPRADRDDGRDERKRKDADDEAAPPLATSPAGLLQPRAADALQEKLIARGYLEPSSRSGKLDGKTQRALREFQREQGLPATGTPDDLTVHKLGLSPDDVFRSADDRKH